MSITILNRSRLTHTRSTPVCKSCNVQLQFSQPSYLLLVHLTVPGRVSVQERKFTVHVCPTCNRKDDKALITALWTWVLEHYDNEFATDYMKLMMKQGQPER